MSDHITVGPYVEPPIIDRYLFKMDGERFERVQQKLESGGWHRIDINCRTFDVHEWFWIPNEDGYFFELHVLPDRMSLIDARPSPAPSPLMPQ